MPATETYTETEEYGGDFAERESLNEHSSEEYETLDTSESRTESEPHIPLDPISEDLHAYKGGNVEDWSVVNSEQSLFSFDAEKGLIDNTGGSFTEAIEKSGDREAIALHREMLQQWNEGGSSVFRNPDYVDGNTIYITYMILSADRQSVGSEIRSYSIDRVSNAPAAPEQRTESTPETPKMRRELPPTASEKEQSSTTRSFERAAAARAATPEVRDQEQPQSEVLQSASPTLERDQAHEQFLSEFLGNESLPIFEFENETIGDRASRETPIEKSFVDAEIKMPLETVPVQLETSSLTIGERSDTSATTQSREIMWRSMRIPYIESPTADIAKPTSNEILRPGSMPSPFMKTTQVVINNTVVKELRGITMKLPKRAA